MIHKIFCSHLYEDNTVCSEAAVGEIGIVAGNNPLPGREIRWLPVCEKHRGSLDNLSRDVVE